MPAPGLHLARTLSAPCLHLACTPALLTCSRRATQCIGTWRRDLATKCYWQLAKMKPDCAAHYAEALQFIRWRVRCRTSSRAVTAWLFQQLELAPKLAPAAQLRQAQAMVFTIEQLRLPMAQETHGSFSVVDQPMTMVQAWYDHAMQECSAAPTLCTGGCNP